MPVKYKSVRQSVTLPSRVAGQVQRLAKRSKLSTSRMMVELLEEGLEARKAREQRFFELAERFRQADDAGDVARLGDELGKMIFGK